MIIGPGVKKVRATAFFDSVDSFPTFLNYESIFIHLPCVNFDVKNKFLNVVIVEKLKNNIPVQMSSSF